MKDGLYVHKLNSKYLYDKSYLIKNRVVYSLKTGVRLGSDNLISKYSVNDIKLGTWYD